MIGPIMFLVFVASMSVLGCAYEELVKPNGSILKACLITIPAAVIGFVPMYYLFFVRWI